MKKSYLLIILALLLLIIICGFFLWNKQSTKISVGYSNEYRYYSKYFKSGEPDIVFNTSGTLHEGDVIDLTDSNGGNIEVKTSLNIEKVGANFVTISYDTKCTNMEEEERSFTKEQPYNQVVTLIGCDGQGGFNMNGYTFLSIEE